MAPELPILYGDPLQHFAVAVPVAEVRRARAPDGRRTARLP